MNNSDTKQIILEAGAKIIHLKGYNHAGLQEILKEAGVPKGSFYFHYASKEALGLQIIDYYTVTLDALFSKCLQNESLPPLKRLEQLFNIFESGFSRKDFTLGCPIGNLALEMSDLNENFRKKLDSAIRLLTSHVKKCLEDARKDGSLSESINTDDAALFIFYSIEGAIMHLKTVKSTAPLATCKKCIMDYLKA
ncbi:MAG TPA: TetR family transcriptional regulator C-terminal domain-containing protein [Spirochaetota bacterium]|nr:TetR family transcriptional regulator C-terminal domain-containing protein [Spirochaetota bacterium]HPI91259.1 TetR family transcriptional regulator C-terminal domain-containing protein [Spirochaetota bacterium]HPR47448.1 TetR family transcriptional regulator C-terminal domain-containing protein [Spirochaetota bacterium]